MRRSVPIAVAMIVLLAIIVSCAQAATGPLIKDVLGDPMRYAKERVSLYGVVSNSGIAAPQPGARTKFKGEFDLTDDTGAVIHVKTTKNPPANGSELWVKGTVDATVIPPVLIVKGTMVDRRLIAALAVLLVLAVVLVVLLVRKPVEHPGGVTEIESFGPELPLPPPPAAPDLVCPKCAAANPAGSNFCQNCREPLGVVAPTSSGGLRGASAPTAFYEPDEPILADLIVVDGDGARRNTQFALTKKKQRIGRGENMDIRLDSDGTVSREHAAIWWEDGSFYIQDLASTSGTYVRGQKVVKQSLMDKDEIQLGRTRLVFRMIAREAPVT